MKEIVLNASQKSVITCGEGAFEKIAPLVKAQKSFLLTDSNVFELYGGLIRQAFGNTPCYVLPAGEENKNFARLGEILSAMGEAELLRTSCLFALGGGVVGDIGGLAAALYMRGIKCVQIPTTLLAQVDSSVGGKTAVDMGGIKNLVGAFYQPELVFADPMFFKTLPVREIKCGLGEIVKYAGLDAEIYREVVKHKDNLYDLSFLAEITYACISHKANVVRKDERETGLRKSLNMGHTTGHAYELYDKKMSHGEYVLVGMWYETEIAKRKGFCKEEYANSLQELVRAVLGKIPVLDEACLKGALMDKKNEKAGVVTFVAPVSKGIFDLVKLPYEEYVAEILKAAEAIQC